MSPKVMIGLTVVGVIAAGAILFQITQWVTPKDSLPMDARPTNTPPAGSPLTKTPGTGTGSGKPGVGDAPRRDEPARPPIRPPASSPSVASLPIGGESPVRDHATTAPIVHTPASSPATRPATSVAHETTRPTSGPAATPPREDRPTAAPTTRPAIPAVPTTALARPPVAKRSYVIEKGDTLMKIAEAQLGDAKQWKRIKEANPTIDENRLRVGDALVMPDVAATSAPSRAAPAKPDPAKPTDRANGAAPTTYTVIDGDRLVKIARTVLKDENRWQEIFELNRDQLRDANDIRPGMVLKLPPMKPGAGASPTSRASTARRP